MLWVTVPSAAQSDLRLAALKRRYAATMIALTLAFTALAAFAGFLIAGDTSRQDAATSGLGGVVACAAALGPAVASFPLMLRNRRKVAAIKRAEGWAAEGRERVAVVGEGDVPRPISLSWNLPYVVVMIATLALGAALYPSMPDLVPLHADLSGAVDRWAEKSVASVFGLPLSVEALLGLVFLGCHAAMIHSKRETDPEALLPPRSPTGFSPARKAFTCSLSASSPLLASASGSCSPRPAYSRSDR